MLKQSNASTAVNFSTVFCEDKVSHQHPRGFIRQRLQKPKPLAKGI